MKTILAITAMAAAIVLSACQPAAQPAEPANPSPARAGIWISPAEIAKLPTSGTAWNEVHEAATGSWGKPTVADQNSDDDVNTLAGALVAVRTNDAALKTKVRKHLMDLAASHPYDRVLALARELPSYVIAADVVGLDSTQRASFERFLREARTHKMSGHSGGTDLVSTAHLSPNNWGTMARGALAAVDAYLGDDASLKKLADTQEAWLGGRAPNTLKYTSTSWHAGPKAGVNARGATISGHDVGGVLPEDQRRTGDYTWPAPKGSYPHEALQGAVVASVILDRAGVLDFNAGDSALLRAERWLSTTNANPPANDDGNTPWLLNAYGGGSFARSASASPGKNIGWAAWTSG
ncbi:MAG TPA: hypothetical protein VNS19_08185 [Acidimicrobiales bacterium]|nr:hypothetical protein [Acidimicrobiales bacterium]